MKKLINSFRYAFCGILSAIKSERNMKIHFTFVLLVIIFGIIYKISINEWIYCLICFALVISSEMINTAIEINTNMVMPKKNINAKNTKDIAAGAVLVSAIISFIVGLLIFLPKIFHF